MDHAADAGAEKTHRSNGETETLAALKTVFRFVNDTVIHGLTTALTKAEGQQHTCCGEEVLDQNGGYKRDAETKNCLQKVGGNCGNTGVEDLNRALAAHLGIGAFESGSNETQCQRVIGDHFQRCHAVSAKEDSIVHYIAGHQFIESGNYHQNQTAQHRCGNQRSLQNRKDTLQRVSSQQTQQE